MKKIFAIFMLFLFFLTSGCEVKTTFVETDNQEVKNIIPFSKREFIYNNAIKTEFKESTTKDDNGVPCRYSYHEISGLKDKAIEEKINKEILEVGRSLLTELEEGFLERNTQNKLKISQKFFHSFVSYSFNNVIFVDYDASIEYPYVEGDVYPRYKCISYGYDLNTGERLVLADIFKPGSDYKTKINNFVSQYIIENNYDDYESNLMKKPFQGIKENQNFSFLFEGLRIVLDEKNDEFVNNGYSESIFIPVSYLSDDLYIFDKYFEEGKSIFEKEKLIKKLFPNKLEFKRSKSIEEGYGRRYISITKGEFINVPNKYIEKKLNNMIVSNFDVEAFRKDAKSSPESNEEFFYGHYINIPFNAGGYLSVAVNDEKFSGNKSEINKITFNYDFKTDKELQLKDLFEDSTDIAKVIKDYIRSIRYPITDEMLEKGVEESIKSNIFNFHDSGIIIYFSPEGATLDSMQQWVWIPFEAFGMENISFLN